MYDKYAEAININNLYVYQRYIIFKKKMFSVFTILPIQSNHFFDQTVSKEDAKICLYEEIFSSLQLYIGRCFAMWITVYKEHKIKNIYK